ncbi:hypothetical protein E4N79_07900 [Treponema denticola]|nr:hypothetical protein E4N79_07900 [Treponema denticola]
MGKRGIFDAFQAASGAVESVLNAADKELQLKAQMEVQDAALKDMEAFNQFTLDMQNSNDWENYEKNWEDFRVKVYNDTSKGLSSPFARRVYDSQYKNEEMKQRLLVKSIANQKMRAQDFSKGFDYINNVILSNSFVDQEIIDETGNKFIKTGSQQKKELIDNKLYTMYDRGLLSYEQFNQSMRDSYANLMNHDMVTLGKNLVDSGASIEEVTSKLQEYKNEFVTVAGGRITEEAVKGKATEEVEKYYYKQRSIKWQKAEKEEVKNWTNVLSLVQNGKIIDARSLAEGRINELQNIQAQSGEAINPNTADLYTQKYYDFLQNIDKYIKSGSPLAALGSLDIKKFAAVYAEKWKYGMDAYDENGGKTHVSANEIKIQMLSDIDKIAKIKGVPAAYVFPGVIEEFYKQIEDVLPPGLKEPVKKYKETYDTLRKAQLGVDKLPPEEQKAALENAGNFVEGLLNIVGQSRYPDLANKDLLALMEKQSGKNTAKMFDSYTGSSGALWWKKESAENLGKLVAETTQPGVITKDRTGTIVIREEAKAAVAAHENDLRRETAIALGLNPNDEKDIGKLSIFHDTEANRIYCTYGTKASYFETDKNGKAVLRTVDWKTKEVKTTEKLSEEVRQNKKDAKIEAEKKEMNDLIHSGFKAESIQRDIKPFYDKLNTQEDRQRFLQLYSAINQREKDKNIGRGYKLNKDEVINSFKKGISPVDIINESLIKTMSPKIKAEYDKLSDEEKIRFIQNYKKEKKDFRHSNKSMSSF